jgi:hypothetical protein
MKIFIYQQKIYLNSLKNKKNFIIFIYIES